VRAEPPRPVTRPEERDGGGEVRVVPKLHRRIPLALKSGNGQIIATSGEGYVSKDGATNGIDAVKREAAAARTEDLT